MSSQSFADLGVSSPVCDALAKRGFESPFAIQRLVIADVLEGRDLLAKSPTGSGKTIAFMAPIADLIEATDRRPAALILAPTRELAQQIVEEGRTLAHSRALKVTAVYGGAGIHKQAQEANKAHILVATPGRLEDLLQRRAITLEHVRLLVLDEADRMLDMGFRPAVDRIVAKCRKERQTLFFSATLDGEAGKVAREYTHDAVVHEHTPPQQKVASVEHRFVGVEHDHRVNALIKELKAKRDLALVFVRTKRGADRLVKKLAREGVEAVAMHGDKSQSQREKALSRFESFQVDVLVATDVAARGIDVDGVSHVINFDPPEDREGYVHRIGRTGRAGRTGVGVTLFSPDQRRDVHQLAKELRLEASMPGSPRGSEPARPTGRPPARPQGGGRGGQRGRRGAAR